MVLCLSPCPSVRKVPSPPVAQSRRLENFPLLIQLINWSLCPTNFYNSYQSLTSYLCPVPSQTPVWTTMFLISSLIFRRIPPFSCQFSILSKEMPHDQQMKRLKPSEPKCLCCLRIQSSHLEQFLGLFNHCPVASDLYSSLFLYHSELQPDQILDFPGMALNPVTPESCLLFLLS